MRTILQTEAGECGLACLAMVSVHYGRHYDLMELRQKFSFGSKGATLLQIINNASSMSLSARAVRLEADQCSQLRLPCILHWNMNHFVVLEKITRSLTGVLTYVVHDPAVGRRGISGADLQRSFTGVALELSPLEEYESKAPAPRIPISTFTGKVVGLKLALVQVLVLAFCIECLTLLMPLFNQLIIDDAVTSGDIELMTVLMLGFGLVLVTRTLIELARSWFITRWSVDVGLQWSSRLFGHLVRLPVSYFEKRHLGDVTSRFGSITAIQTTMTSLFVESALDGLMALFAIGMMIFYSPLLSVAVAVCVGAYILLRACFYSPLRQASSERLVLAARENSNFLETIRAIAAIKSFGKEADRLMQWQNAKLDVANRDVRTQKMTLAFRLLSSFINSAQALLLFYIGGRLVIQSDMTLGMLTAFASYASTFSSRIFNLIDAAINFRMLSMHTERLRDIVGTLPENIDETNGIDIEKVTPSIVLRNVRFRYSDSEPWVLDMVNMEIFPQERIALVGVSGSGKTTLAKIIVGLLEPTEGEVLVGDVPVRQLGLRNFRAITGTVMQNDVLISGSIGSNISFYDPDVNIKKVEYCARIAQVHDEIMKMPMGYHTSVGDLGANLSGGQKQRILLARALYKDPKILALDEATSHLDVDAERMIAFALEHIPLTQVVVAHRPQAISSAQRVFRVCHGKVEEIERTGVGVTAA